MKFKPGDIVRLLVERARAADADRESIGIGRGHRGVEWHIAPAEGEGAVQVSLVGVESTGVLVLHTQFDVVIAAEPRQEPAKGLFGLDAVIDARLGRVVLLVRVILECQRNRALREVASIRIEAMIRERDVFARPRHPKCADLGAR